MKYLKEDLFPNEISEKNKKIKNALMNIWKVIYDFQNTIEFRAMELKDKREYKKLEDKFFKLSKMYYNDMLQQESNTTERTIDI